MKIREIAKIANVSPATVSLVINGKKGVGEATRKRVLAIIEDFGYQARSIVEKGRTYIGKLKVLAFNNNSFQENEDNTKKLLSELTLQGTKLGFETDITFIVKENYHDYINVANKSEYVGLIVVATEMNRREIERFKILDIPVVLLDNPIDYINFDSISINNKNMMYKLISLLHEDGLTDIGYIRSSFLIENYKARYSAYLKILSKFGIEYDTSKIFFANNDFDRAVTEMLNLFKNNQSLPKTLLVENNVIFMAITQAFKLLQKSLDDYVFVLFNNALSSRISEAKYIVDNKIEFIALNALRIINNKVLFSDQSTISISIDPIVIKK